MSNDLHPVARRTYIDADLPPPEVVAGWSAPEEADAPAVEAAPLSGASAWYPGKALDTTAEDGRLPDRDAPPAAREWDTNAGGLDWPGQPNGESGAWRHDGCPPWQAAIIRLVRPVGVALMFLMLTLAGLLFAIVEGVAPGAGVRMAAAMAGYFGAIPTEFYVTLGVMYGAYTFARTVQAVGSLPRRSK